MQPGELYFFAVGWYDWYDHKKQKEVRTMKACHNCGATLEENSPFCPNCGAQAAQNLPAQAKESISVGGWIGRQLIPCIPLVGSIVYLIMLFIWSGDKKKEDTFRNWAKAQLIIMAVVIVLTVLFAVLFGATFAELAASL